MFQTPGGSARSPGHREVLLWSQEAGPIVSTVFRNSGDRELAQSRKSNPFLVQGQEPGPPWILSVNPVHAHSGLPAPEQAEQRTVLVITGVVCASEMLIEPEPRLAVRRSM